MINEEIGENIKHFFRISLIVELIKKDVNYLIEKFNSLKDIAHEVESTCANINHINEKIMSDTKIEIDPVSQN